MNAFLDHLASIARAAAALLAAWLPRRRWSAFPELAIEESAGLSGLVAVASGALLGGIGFMRYARRAAEGAVNASLHIAERQVRNELPGEITTFTTQGVSALSVVAFVFFTPLGLLALYLVVTGLLRALASHADDPFGDPILTGLDAAFTGFSRSARDARARKAREREEGAEAPDRLLAAGDTDAPGFDLLVVSSRRKPEWTPGTFVITGDRWYTLGEAFEVRMPEGLRTVYPLKEQKATEVLRRGVQYELPPLEEGRLTARETTRRQPLNRKP